MGTFLGTALDWFISLPDAYITSFDQLSTLFKEKYIANQDPTPIYFNLFDAETYQGEPLKDFFNRFEALVVKLYTKDEEMMVHAFKRDPWKHRPCPTSRNWSSSAHKGTRGNDREETPGKAASV